MDSACGFITQKLSETYGLLRTLSKHSDRGGIYSADRFVLIGGNYSGWNVLEDRFHQGAPAFQFLHGLLQVMSEHIDLAAAIAELFGHFVEGPDQNAKFILR